MESKRSGLIVPNPPSGGPSQGPFFLPFFLPKIGLTIYTLANTLPIIIEITMLFFPAGETMIFKDKPAHKIFFVLFLMVLLIFPMVNCNQQQGGDSSSDFAIQPGDVTAFTIPATKEFNITHGSTESYGPAEDCHAIIFSGSIDSGSYTGVAVSDDPEAPNSFYMLLYFPGSSVPANVTLDSANPDHMIKVRDNGTSTFDEFDGGTISLSFTEESDGTYTITQNSSTATVGSTAFSISLIRAYKY